MPPRLRRGSALVLLLVLAAAVVGAVVGGFTDLHVYRFAGESVLDGRLGESRDPVTGLPFTYPPFAAVLFVPLALVPGWVAAALWTAASVAALAGTVALTQRSLGREPVGWQVALLATCSLALEPVWQNLTFGQVNLLLMLAVVVDLLQPERRWSGVLLGLAVGVKLTPVAFVVLLVLVGRQSAAARATAVAAVTVAVGYLVAPAASASYWGERLLDASRVGPPALAHNQSVYGALTRLLDGEPPTWAWLAVAGPVALAALLVAARWWRAGDRALGTGLAGLAMLIASPVAWSHHWVWAVPTAIALWRHGRVLCLTWSALFVLRPFTWPPHADGREYAWSWPEHLLGNAYLLGAVALVAWAGAQAASARRGAVPPGINVGGQSQVSPQGR